MYPAMHKIVLVAKVCVKKVESTHILNLVMTVLLAKTVIPKAGSTVLPALPSTVLVSPYLPLYMWSLKGVE